MGWALLGRCTQIAAKVMLAKFQAIAPSCSMSVAPNKAAENLSAIIESIPIKVGKDKFRIFLFGPSLKADQIVAEPRFDDSLIDHARFLRYFVAKVLRDAGWLVDFGEDPQMLEMWAKLRGPIDQGKMEYDHAFAACGAIVVLPSSPGSFCEMGLFASSKDISRKTLAVVHAEYKDAQSFFRQGLVRVFQSRSGRCAYETYKNKEAVLAAIREFIEDRFNSYQWDENDITVGERRKRESANHQL